MEKSVKRVDSIEDMFDILDGVAAKRKRYTEIVTEYLKQKPRVPFYKVWYEDCNDNEYTFLKPICEDDMADIIATARQFDPDDECDLADNISEESETFSDKKYFQMVGRFGYDLYITAIDLDKKYYCYKFRFANFENGIDQKPEIFDAMLYLTDEDYIYLTVEHMLYPSFSLARLRKKRSELYDDICSIAEQMIREKEIETSAVLDIIPQLYLAEFTEIKEDAERLLGSIESKIY